MVVSGMKTECYIFTPSFSLSHFLTFSLSHHIILTLITILISHSSYILLTHVAHSNTHITHSHTSHSDRVTSLESRSDKCEELVEGLMMIKGDLIRRMQVAEEKTAQATTITECRCCVGVV